MVDATRLQAAGARLRTASAAPAWRACRAGPDPDGAERRGAGDGRPGGPPGHRRPARRRLPRVRPRRVALGGGPVVGHRGHAPRSRRDGVGAWRCRREAAWVSQGSPTRRGPCTRAGSPAQTRLRRGRRVPPGLTRRVTGGGGAWGWPAARPGGPRVTRRTARQPRPCACHRRTAWRQATGSGQGPPASTASRRGSGDLIAPRGSRATPAHARAAGPGPRQAPSRGASGVAGTDGVSAGRAAPRSWPPAPSSAPPDRGAASPHVRLRVRRARPRVHPRHRRRAHGTSGSVRGAPGHRRPYRGEPVTHTLSYSRRVYCAPRRHEALERSLRWLTGKGASHAPTNMGYRPARNDRHAGSSGQIRGRMVACVPDQPSPPCGVGQREDHGHGGCSQPAPALTIPQDARIPSASGGRSQTQASGMQAELRSQVAT